MIPLTISTWNLHTLIDNTKSSKPERRTALVATELNRFCIQIAALSETRLANEGQLTEVGTGYAFFWSGCSEGERYEAGMGFAIKTNLISKLVCLPKGVNDRLMTMQLPLTGKRHTTIISAYAPTMMNPDEGKKNFMKT